MWYVYVDWTMEEAPRPFYVGKGSLSRVRQTKRNSKHTHISTLYGFRRQVVLEVPDEQEALSFERSLIVTLRTLPKDSEIGCNFTKGGQGTCGHTQSADTRAKIRHARLGVCRPHTEETRQKMSRAKRGLPPNNKGKRLSVETRRKMSIAKKAQPRSEEWRKRISVAMIGNKNGTKGITCPKD